MMSQPCWASSNQLVHSKNSRGMTLLHLAAAQGYAGLIQTLIRWRWVTHEAHDAPLRTHRLHQLISLLLSLQHEACRQYWPRAGGGSSQRRPLLLHSVGERSIFLNGVLSVFLSLMPVSDLCFLLTSSDVGMCSGPHWGSVGALPVGPESSGYSWFAGTLAAQHRPIPGPHSIGWALGAAATDSSSSGPACWHLDGQVERRVTDQRNKQQSYPKP